MSASAQVGVVICNWNKREDLLRCIRSVLTAEGDVHVYVADNGSTDGSAERVREVYGDQVTLVASRENRGGAAGFNMGMRAALDGGHPLLYLLDNDVIVDKEAIVNAANKLQETPALGAVGSTVLRMDNPDVLQEMGGDIDWANFQLEPHAKGRRVDDGLPDVWDCDYVPTCAVMVRRDAVLSVGLMDEGCFVYWDDVEWFYRMTQAGFGVIATSNSWVQHRMGVRDASTTFGTYYFWRNRVNFFATRIGDDEVDFFLDKLTSDALQAMHLSMYHTQPSVATTVMQAIEDALAGVRGPAPTNRIVQREPRMDRWPSEISSGTAIRLWLSGDVETDRSVVDFVHTKVAARPLHLVLADGPADYVQTQFGDIATAEADDSAQPFTVRVCDHVLNVATANLGPDTNVWVDKYRNVVATEADLVHLGSHRALADIWAATVLPVWRERLTSLRAERMRVGVGS